MALRDNLSNEDILNAIRGQASNDYQRRVPAATKANLQETMQNMWRYQPTRNEFVDALVNQIGLILFTESQMFENPLAKFKIGMLPFGDTIEEVMVGLVKATNYDSDRDSLERDVWGQSRPDVQSRFHKINRQDKYKITINSTMLQRALETGQLGQFAGQLMAAPAKSDQWDEFLLMSQLFPEYHNGGGFFKVNVPDLTLPTSDAADAKYFLRRTREMADTLPFISTHYNAAGMPVAANRADLELFITPEANAAADVEALAAAFNIDRADMPSRTTVIPREHFGIEGAQAILTTKDFFKVADTFMETRSIQNPDGLYDNYWLHHHGVIAASPFVPAILYTTEPGDIIVINETPVSGIEAITLSDRAGTVVTTVERGEVYDIGGAAVTTPEGGYNDAVRLELIGNKSQLTYITFTGVLHVGPDEESTNITVKAIATDNNDFTTSKSYTITGPLVIVRVGGEVLEDADSDGLNEVTPKQIPLVPTSGENKNVVKIPSSKYYKYMDGVTDVSGKTLTLTADKTITAVAGAGVEFTSGATTSWSLVFTA